jgi:predicted short-subunit dehydrogenase-like oxidoreductase (DUF2520 family)
MYPTWVLVGAGRCGLGVARAMTAAGIEVVGAEVRSARARARVRRFLPHTRTFGTTASLPPATALLIAVPDPVLGECAASLAPRLHPDTRVALHTSGLLPAAVLGPIADDARAVGAWHPLVSFPTPWGSLAPLDGAVAAVEGSRQAVDAARWLAHRLHMRPLRLAASAKPRYHAAAVIAANLSHVLVVTALAELDRAGVPHLLATEGLRRLVGGSVDAALAARGMERLTGPLARADVAALRSHLDVLPAETAAAYRAVARLAVTALAAGQLLNRRQVHELDAALTE